MNTILAILFLLLATPASALTWCVRDVIPTTHTATSCNETEQPQPNTCTGRLVHVWLSHDGGAFSKIATLRQGTPWSYCQSGATVGFHHVIVRYQFERGDYSCTGEIDAAAHGAASAIALPEPEEGTLCDEDGIPVRPTLEAY